MLQPTTKKGKGLRPLKGPPKPPHHTWKFRGVGRDAAVLGVHRITLWRVLTGKQSNPRLAALYHTLKKSGDATATK